MTESPKCQEPGCGHEMEWQERYFAGETLFEGYECPRNTDAHELCAKVASGEARERALEAQLANSNPVEGCTLVAVDTGEGWCLQVEYPRGHPQEGEVIALLEWPDSWSETVTGKQLKTFGFEVC